MENYGERSGDAQNTTQYAKEVQLLLEEYVRQHRTAAADKQGACQAQPGLHTPKPHRTHSTFPQHQVRKDKQHCRLPNTADDIPNVLLLLLRTYCKHAGSVVNALAL
jgi:hypothetical protein